MVRELFEKQDRRGVREINEGEYNWKHLIHMYKNVIMKS